MCYRLQILFIIFSLILPLFGFGLHDLQELKQENIQGKFTQHKSIVGFPNELTSEGSFQIKQQTLYWNVHKPIQSHIKINQQGIFEYKDSQWIQQTKNYDKGLFLDIITFNIDNLQKNFTMNLQGDKTQWELTLQPKNIWLQKIFTSIKISGAKTIHQIILEEKNGDTTRNVFYQIATQTSTNKA
ncbi:outer membrane lipoprotein carrier protein LolA [Helicobacter aurati]|uniref:Outer membrane lipoprotein carrier protein LolA n=1 Tax=Helicobacter aurati TaxID=137778 RepID=A0A3D8J9S2_9HELI|nr:outer membrane lipoprotein carrier protein LolA [Helicobacter aurati]RDU73641.1 outer membrane lipoprotein carrier protein LolA [Helicobacter aurati]